jgi:hypothetical protein
MSFYFLLHQQYNVKFSICFLTLGCNLLTLLLKLGMIIMIKKVFLMDQYPTCKQFN